jgi:hypothetical protein
VRRIFRGDFGLPPPPGVAHIVRPTDGWRTAGGVPPYGRPSVAYVTPSRRATRTALSNSSSARACHLDVATLCRFSRRWTCKMHMHMHMHMHMSHAHVTCTCHMHMCMCM